MVNAEGSNPHRGHLVCQLSICYGNKLPQVTLGGLAQHELTILPFCSQRSDTGIAGLQRPALCVIFQDMGENLFLSFSSLQKPPMFLDSEMPSPIF